jgi:hypothetical protein
LSFTTVTVGQGFSGLQFFFVCKERNLMS